MWSLYGNKYDFTKFLDKHPGGKEILLKARNEKDVTVLFETYHAFSDKERIRKQMDSYLVEKSNEPYRFNFENYESLTKQVRTLYPDRKSIKTSSMFHFRNIVLMMLYVFSLYLTFVYHNTLGNFVFGLLGGFLIISLGFNVMHDGSHYAISTDAWINDIFSKIWHYVAVFNHDLWFYHHVYHHHSFTNIPEEDPDVYNYRPIIKKIADNNPSFVSKKYLPIVATLFIFLLPGMYLGQCLMYILSVSKSRLFRISIPKYTYYSSKYLWAISLLLLFIIFYQQKFLGLLGYIVSANFFYAINIIPDHDTFETHITNHYEGNDWCKLQICNSGNFNTDNILWTYIFGGINYQIEHHLFPNMSHEHYPKIRRIVQQYCLDNHIPYQEQTVFTAYKSFLRMIQEFSS
jgi:linoleoyl-CoA desaturase